MESAVAPVASTSDRNPEQRRCQPARAATGSRDAPRKTRKDGASGHARPGATSPACAPAGAGALPPASNWRYDLDDRPRRRHFPSIDDGIRPPGRLAPTSRVRRSRGAVTRSVRRPLAHRPGPTRSPGSSEPRPPEHRGNGAPEPSAVRRATTASHPRPSLRGTTVAAEPSTTRRDRTASRRCPARHGTKVAAEPHHVGAPLAAGRRSRPSRRPSSERASSRPGPLSSGSRVEGRRTRRCEAPLRHGRRGRTSAGDGGTTDS